MHHIAEYGVAAHALYKDEVPAAAGNGAGVPRRDRSKESPTSGCGGLVDTLLEGDNPEEFLEHTKLELFQDQVFCFTPKGRLIALPRGATPIDFAYAVHTDIGNSCVGAVINGRQMPLTTQLRNGDEVRGPDLGEGQTPPAAWERIAVTGKARSAIRRAARDALRQQYSELGRRLLVSAFAEIGQDYSDDKLKKVSSAPDAEIGRGRACRRRARRAAVADVVRAVAARRGLAPPAAGRGNATAMSGQAARRAGSISPSDRAEVPLAGQRD